MAQLPKGRFKNEIEALPAQAKKNALEKLNSIHFTDLDLFSLHADKDGGILFACQLNTSSYSPDAEQPIVSAAAVPITPFPTNLVFHSKPGAPNVLFINFNGETVVNTAWNTDPSVNRAEIPAMPFSTDGDYTTFSDAEQAAIKNIWLRMAEDYAPFNIDVTTERPATFGNRVAHALITRNTDANGQPNPYSSAGGVAYVNVFNSSFYSQYRPAWVYINNLSYNESYIAEAASHEIGHNMGLSHDGRIVGTTTNEYYGGHGSGDTSWGPIMGTGYGRNVSQWSKGEYYGGNNSQDDLVIISGKLTYRTDDHAGTPASATALILTGGTNIVSSTLDTDPANINKANKGVLERNTDVDVFSFVTGTGSVSLAVNPWIMPASYRGGNLDVVVELLDAAGALLVSNNPAATTTALIQTNLNAGTYYLRIRNTGTGDPASSTPSGYTVYGSFGQYFIQGYVADPSDVPAAPTSTVYTLYAANMDVNPGWTLEPLWQYGIPAYGLSGSGPSGGFTGSFAIGYDFSNGYPNNLSRKNATTPAINCSGNTNVILSFRRWLRVKNGDTASIEVSTNDTDWISVWASSGAVLDSAWQLVQYTLPPGVAGSETVRIRWGLQSNPSQPEIGWIIDDVELAGHAQPPLTWFTLQAGVNNCAWGSVSITNSAFPKGTIVTNRATPASYYQFENWSGDATGSTADLTLALTSNMVVTANFSPICTVIQEVPYVWLAAYGFTNFEQCVVSMGLNGIPVWQSYVAGLNPTNPSSLYLIAGDVVPQTGGFRVTWNTIPDRLYTVLFSTNLQAGFMPLPGAVDLPPTVTAFTDPATNSPGRFYKVQVRLP